MKNCLLSENKNQRTAFTLSLRDETQTPHTEAQFNRNKGIMHPKKNYFPPTLYIY